jgi:hypothetical protein
VPTPTSPLIASPEQLPQMELRRKERRDDESVAESF